MPIEQIKGNEYHYNRRRGLGKRVVPDQSRDQGQSTKGSRKGSITISSFAIKGKERLDKGRHLVLNALIDSCHAKALIDSGSETDIIDRSFARKHLLKTFKVKKPVSLLLGDGKQHETINEMALVKLQIGTHTEQILCYLANLSKYKIVLGDSWLQDHNPYVNWKKRSLTFNSADCMEKGCLLSGKPHTENADGANKIKTKKSIDIEIVGAKTFYQMVNRKDHQGYMLFPRGNEKCFFSTVTNTVRSEDYDVFMKGKPTYSREELLKRVPKEYHSEIDVFLKEEADVLPPHRREDHEIRLVEGATPPFSR